VQNGWTGGQYSLYRFLLGLYLVWFFAGLLVDESFPRSTVPFAAPGVVCGFALALGWFDRAAAGLALILGGIVLFLSSGAPEASLVFLGWLLFVHPFLQPEPYGSLAAAGRTDPGGGWRLNGWVYGWTWGLMALGYTYTGFSMLLDPGWLPGSLEPVQLWVTRTVLVAHLLFGILALFRRARPWLWLVFALMQFLSLGLLDTGEFAVRMLLLHGFTFDPAWIRSSLPRAQETLFYDGTCGLCHRCVRFLLAEDEHGRWHFAPLDGKAFRERVPEDRRRGLPDSLVLRTESGTLLTRSTAVLHIAQRLGGIWRLLGGGAALVPRALRDAIYDLVARFRHRLFSRPREACPIVPDRLRDRFLE
jgi:predicted DCC family thiol-disulfide oxidoreductase YuxK